MLYSEYYKSMYNGKITKNDALFCKWIDKVETIILKRIKIHLLDLPDEMYMPNFERGMTARKMATIVIKSFIEDYT